MKIVMLMYLGMTPLDLMGPLQVWSQLPEAEIQLVAKQKAPVTTDTVMDVLPTHDFSDSFQEPDIVFVPGGTKATFDLMNDEETLAYLRARSEQASWVCSVCTGALVLAAAGLLKGYRATTHWAAFDVLDGFGVEAVRERYVFDRDRASGGGVTAGIDFGLAMVAKIADDDTAKEIQLSLEYAPAPPFNSGSPESAGVSIVERVVSNFTKAVGG